MLRQGSRAAVSTRGSGDKEMMLGGKEEREQRCVAIKGDEEQSD